MKGRRKVVGTRPSGVPSSSKHEVAKALAALLASEGFRRDGSDWSIVIGNLRWELFLSIDRLDAGTRFDLPFRGVAPATTDGEDARIAGGTVGRLTGRPSGYGADEPAGDALVRDVRGILLPFLRGFPDSESVLEGYLDGRWSERGGSRAIDLGRGWQGADRLGHHRLRDEIERIARAENPTPEDRWVLRWYGLDIGGPHRKEPLPWWRRLFGDGRQARVEGGSTG